MNEDTEILLPLLGSSVDLSDEEACTQALDDVRNGIFLLHNAEQTLKAALKETKDRIALSIHAELVRAGMEPAEADKIVVRSTYYRIDQGAAKRASRDPVFREVLDTHLPPAVEEIP